MTKILVPFKYIKLEVGQPIEKIGYYEDELSNVFNICTKCLSIHDRHSKYCQLCSDEFRSGDEKSAKIRRDKNQRQIDRRNKEIKKRLSTAELTRWGLVKAIQEIQEHGESRKSTKSKSTSKVR